MSKKHCRAIGLLAICVACVVINTPADASELHKCRSKDGKVTFQDSPCQEDLEEKARQRREASARFDERMKEQKKAIAAAPNRTIHKELLKQQVQPASANPSDVAQANKFRADLPPECSASVTYVPDGTVNIRTICNGSGRSMDGIVSIKDGKVIQIR